MTPPQRTQLKAELERLAKALSAKGGRRLEPNKTDAVERPDEDDDQPLNEMNQSIASNRNAHDALVLGKVRAALKRLADEPDDFGACLDCGDDVPFARLKAMPYAEYCIECQGKRDPSGRATRTKLTDYR
ncbi:MAG: TraR/DksA family transcriptional regulator [Myxococcales bacterium]|nr:TraR/DksA family transcriptional regulator [Myxococcales bacterium]